MNIKGLSKAKVLAALYNQAQPLGMGMLQYTPEDMSEDEAQSILDRVTDFDYVKGRVLKVNLSGDEVGTHLYNRDNGPGAAERAVDAIRYEEGIRKRFGFGLGEQWRLGGE